MLNYKSLRPLLFSLQAETAHELGINGLKILQATNQIRQLVQNFYQIRNPILETKCLGLDFPTPIGMAAGFDKDGEVVNAIAALGFGFVEVGTVTPMPQPGNPRPRLFRLPEDEGIINRLGFNGAGAEYVRDQFDLRGLPDVPVGVNIGKMNDSSAEKAIDDYRNVVNTFGNHPDYFVVNVSCPNTPEKYDEQSPDHLATVFSTLVEAKPTQVPLLVKVGPDSSRESLQSLVEIVHDHDLDGIIATNTTTDHDGLQSQKACEWGGVSGKPLEQKANRTIRVLASLTDLPIIGVGGVRDAESAYRKILAGSSLVQLYTGFVYGGPSTAKKINRGIVELLKRDGFDTVSEAVGADL